MKKILTHRLSILIELLLTVFICLIIVLNITADLKKNAASMASETLNDYNTLIDKYTSVFNALTIQVKDELAKNPSFEDMNLWLQSKNSDFAEAVGTNVFDGFAMTYKGGYAHSWDYGNYDNYDPSTRLWYIQAGNAGGKVAVVAPYVTYLDPSYLNSDQYIEMTIAQKYNDEISFDMDLKIKEVGAILAKRLTEYENTITMMIDSSGYVLSTNRKELYCHNINTVDNVINKDFSSAVVRSATGNKELQFINFGSKHWIGYSHSSIDGNTVCIFTPFTDIFVKKFLSLSVMAVLLIGLELLIFVVYRRKMSALAERESFVSGIANAAFEKNYYVNLEKMRCIYNNEKTEIDYKIIYDALYNDIINETERKEFRDFLSPEILKSSEPCSLKTKQFATSLTDSDGKRLVHMLEFGLIISDNKHGKFASIFINNITEKVKFHQMILQSIAYHYSSAFVGKLNEEYYEAIKTEQYHSFDNTASIVFTENQFKKISDKIKSKYKEAFLTFISFKNIKKRLESENDYAITLESEANHWYTLRIIKSIGYEKTKEFILCVENVDKQMERQKELREALSQAQIATQAKSEFLSRISHEIRTPMNAIMALTKIADSHIYEPKSIRDYLSKINFSSSLLLSIINDVLDMSAIESSKLKIAEAKFDIDAVLKGIADIYCVQCKNKGVDFNVHTSLTDKCVMGDSLRINQILLNLISNAYKFTEKGGKISVSAEETERRDNKVFIRFVVSDTGIGMSEEMLGRLFTPFEQESALTNHKYGGSGLGLSIAKNLIELMHGAIRAESKKGIGTSFIVDIPFNICNSESTADTEKLTLKSYDFSSHRLLLVEDNEMNTAIMTDLLTIVNMSADHAKNGKEAVEMFKNSTPGTYDLILMDIQMPILDGYGATKLIRSSTHSDAKLIPIYAMTANAFTEDISNSISIGMNGHLAKPVDIGLLYSTIDKCISNTHFN